MDAIQIAKLATLAPSADNSQPWHFRVKEGTFICTYRHHLLTKDPFGTFGHASLISCGALLSNLSDVAGQNQCQPEWLLTESAWKIVLPHFLSLPTIPLDQVTRLEMRHTNRHPYLSTLQSDLMNLPTSSTCRAINATSKEQTKILTNAIARCSAARFDCKELHEWLFSSIRWTPQEVDSGTGLDIDTLHLPPGGRTLMHWISPWSRMELLNRFGIGRVMAAADAALVRKSPGIIAIVSGDSPEETVESGRLMQRIWLELNARGIAVHPYYVLTDQWNRRKTGKLDPKWHTTIDNAIAMANEALGLSQGEHIHMLLRVGRPSCSPVRSRRLPVSAFMDTSTASC